MLIMPGPEGLPTGIWEEAETKEMEDVVGLYGKTYHFWQVDRGDKLPLGGPELMMSFTGEGQQEGLSELIGERDSRFKVSSKQKRDKRAYIEEPEVHEGTGICEIWVIVYADNHNADADRVWKDSSASEDSKQQPAGATSDETSLLKGIHLLTSPALDHRLADISQAPTHPLKLSPLTRGSRTIVTTCFLQLPSTKQEARRRIH